MKWTIVRHADKEKGDYYNPKLRHQDQPISVKGQVEARQLYSFFGDRPVARFYVSEYVRTGQTIKYVARKMKQSPIVDARLNEVDNGLIEGLSGQEIQQKFPAVWRAFRERDRDFQFQEGESGEDALQLSITHVGKMIADNPHLKALIDRLERCFSSPESNWHLIYTPKQERKNLATRYHLVYPALAYFVLLRQQSPVTNCCTSLALSQNGRCQLSRSGTDHCSHQFP